MTDPHASHRFVKATRILVPLILLIVVLALWGRQIWFAASPFIIGLVLAYIMHPAVSLLERRVCRGRRLLAVLLLYALVVVIVIPIVIILAIGVAGELIDLYTDLPIYWNNLKQLGQAVLDNLPPLPKEFVDRIEPVRERIDTLFRDPEALRRLWKEQIAPLLAAASETRDQNSGVAASDVARTIGKGVSGVVSGVTTVLYYLYFKFISWTGGIVSFIMTTTFVVIIVFYVLLDYEKFGAAIVRLVPPPIRNDFVRIWREIDKQLSGFLRGQISIAICVGILSATLYTIIGVDFGILIGLFAGACNVIPYLGPVMGLVPAVFSSLIEQYSNGWGSVLWQLMWVGIVYGFVQFAEGFFIAPRVMSGAVNLNPMIIMFVLLLGGSLGGILGMLLAVPLACVVRVLVNELYLKPLEESAVSDLT